jgi:hypothetical protein
MLTTITALAVIGAAELALNLLRGLLHTANRPTLNASGAHSGFTRLPQPA